MRKYLFIFMCLSLTLQAQYNALYAYKFVPDPNKKDSTITNLMTLEISIDKKSKFYNDDKKRSDSLNNNLLQNNFRDGNLASYNVNTNYIITKDLKKDETVYHFIYSGVKMKILEKEKPSWEVKKETRKIGDYLCQKAVTNYKGREWIAWFSNKIPVFDGPYKFSGLPGFIVEIHDEKKEHDFLLIKLKKDSTINFSNSTATEKEITKDQLNKMLNSSSGSINGSIKSMNVSGDIATFTMKDGNVVQINKNVENIEVELSKKVKRNLNPIELE